MRYQPIATAAVRAAARDFEMGGYKVEKDSVLYLVGLGPDGGWRVGSGGRG